MESPLHRFFRNSADAVFGVDWSGRINFWNERCAGLTGLDFESVRGRHCCDVLNGMDLDGAPRCRKGCEVSRKLALGTSIPNYDMVIKGRDMTPQHMVEHLYKTVQSSINEIALKVYTEERKIPVLKRLFFGKRDLPKDFMNPAIGPDLLPLQFDNLEAAIIEPDNVLIRYNKFFENNPTAMTIHPVFGYLTKNEWDIFHQKHFKHHLSQFGLSD